MDQFNKMGNVEYILLLIFCMRTQKVVSTIPWDAGQGSPVTVAVCASAQPSKTWQSAFHLQEQECVPVLMIPQAGMKKRWIIPVFLRQQANHSITI